jgi:hypothetical protein
MEWIVQQNGFSCSNVPSGLRGAAQREDQP